MTQDEARPLILDAWRAWIKDQNFKEAKGHDGLYLLWLSADCYASLAVVPVLRGQVANCENLASERSLDFK
jgi:hypothetical protein